ncbi:hypothetical protein AB0I28_23835 [Phytomonospora sp. NPDC050363]
MLRSRFAAGEDRNKGRAVLTWEARGLRSRFAAGEDRNFSQAAQ